MSAIETIRPEQSVAIDDLKAELLDLVGRTADVELLNLSLELFRAEQAPPGPPSEAEMAWVREQLPKWDKAVAEYKAGKPGYTAEQMLEKLKVRNASL